MRPASFIVLGSLAAAAAGQAQRPAGAGQQPTFLRARGCQAAGTVKQTVELRTTTAGPGTPHVDIGSRLDLAPGRYEIRMAIQDPASGRAGSAHISVTIPDYARAPLELSGIVLERARASAADGPVAGIIRIVPTTVRTFGPTDRVTAMARIYQGTARTEPIQPVRVHTRIQSASGDLPVDHEFVVDAARFTAGRAADCRMDLPLADLPPGEYLLSVDTAIGDNRAAREVRFTVAGR